MEREKANNCRIPHKPIFPFIIIILASLFLGLTLAPSFHDGFFLYIDDERLSWLISIILGLVASGSITYLMLEFISAANSSINFIGIGGGFSVCLGLACLRYWSAAGSHQGKMLVLAFLLIELGLVLLIERTASGLRRRYLIYIRDKEEEERYKALVVAAWKRAERSGQELAEIRKNLETCLNLIRDRISGVGQKENLQELLVKTVLDGYDAGIAEIEGRYHGHWEYKERPDSDEDKEE